MIEVRKEGVLLYDDSPARADLRQIVVDGLSASPKRLPATLFYDARGSELFERICELPEYYLTRTEIGIMRDCASELAAEVGPRPRVVEFGSGSSVKTRVLLDDLERPTVYVPIDISQDPLVAAAQALEAEYPELAIQPLCADYSQPLRLPEPPCAIGSTLVFFPGSTIGNLSYDESIRIMRRMRLICGRDGGVLIGIDLEKDPAVLERAYDDAEGVTAEFNLNVLRRIDDELGGDADVSAFVHRAFWDAENRRIEMQLVSVRDQEIHIGSETFALAEGEAITTEHCHKYSLEVFGGLARAAGLAIDEVWTDPDEMFAVVLLRVA